MACLRAGLIGAGIIDLMGYPCKCSTLRECSMGPKRECTIRVASRNYAVGSRTTMRVWISWTGCDGPGDSSARTATPLAVGASLMGAIPVEAAGVGQRDRWN